ncbi:hypothetical protein ACE1B6_29855 [Aerosakkonemataceae cyanobacterium BLCC-F154]|uniref:Uncharacterized protein n=1 Tax=Floridaenema fluviatile BLCC-F154 TaxID=3153640 RepID=A0ABV4YMN2_9CYAN
MTWRYGKASQTNRIESLTWGNVHYEFPHLPNGELVTSFLTVYFLAFVRQPESCFLSGFT